MHSLHWDRVILLTMLACIYIIDASILLYRWEIPLSPLPCLLPQTFHFKHLCEERGYDRLKAMYNIMLFIYYAYSNSHINYLYYRPVGVGEVGELWPPHFLATNYYCKNTIDIQAVRQWSVQLHRIM